MVHVFSLCPNSCSREDTGYKFRPVSLPVISADLRETFELHKSYTIKVTYLIPDSCTFFQGFDTSEEGNSLRNVVEPGSRPERRSCAEIASERIADFDFICLNEST